MVIVFRADSVRLPEQPIEVSPPKLDDEQYGMGLEPQQRFAQNSCEDNNFDIDDGFERRRDVIETDVMRYGEVREIVKIC